MKNSCRVANRIFRQHKMTGCQSEDEEPNNEFCKIKVFTVLPAKKSDSDIMICLQSYQGLIIDRSLV